MSSNARNPADFRQILKSVASGRLSPEEAEIALREAHLVDLEFATIDLQRQARRGRPEMIYCERKTAEQIVAIATRMAEAGQNVLMTRITAEQMPALVHAFRGREFDVNDAARIGQLVVQRPPRKETLVAVIAAGTSDLPVAEEAVITCESIGAPVDRIYDVGVAGIHRLFAQLDRLRGATCLICVAGMEGALPSVVTGLVPCPVIGVPTSVGYGASFHGVSALLTMLNSCATGLAVVNIDNGFGAGALAATILRTANGKNP